MKLPRPYILACSLPLSLFAAEWTKHVIQPAEGVKGGINTANAADFNRDGKLDVIASHSGAVFVYPGPDFTSRVQVHDFRPLKPGQRLNGGCIHSCLMDVDGDGDMDYCGSNRTVFWLECPDTDALGTAWTYRTIDNEIQGTHCLITGDVNRDGRLDLIANSFQTPDRTGIPQSITWQEVPKNPRTAAHWIRHVFAAGDAPGGNHYMGFGDVNKDGRPDIAAGAKGGKGFDGGQWFAWWEQPVDPKAAWKKHLLAEKEPGATNILPADLDGDGHVDYLASRGHGKGVLFFKGPGFTQRVEIDEEIDGPHSLAIADIDADGDLDFATCSSPLDHPIAAWYENDGKAGFTRHVLDRAQSSYDVRIIDLDADGDLDILIAGHFSRNIVWYRQP